ncbi:hypothetical protein [Massilia timonae]|uniref:hypothetical protein n=1 Tax=Massilia timonae TaxID=47229 RepID=UPI0028ACCB64|nr:hypothetical protein [Massilia timonae]
MSLKVKTESLIKCFSGDPDCEVAYQWILHHLRELEVSWLPKHTSKLKNSIKGNLGEFIAFNLSEYDGLCGPDYHAFIAGAVRPLADSPDPGLDISFIYLDPLNDADKDRLYIQEVKTTGNSDLSYGDALISDYSKLLDSTGSLNLSMRISTLKGRMKMERKRPRSEIDRIELLGHTDASKCTKVRLLPTLIHELNGANALARMKKVKSALCNQGWLDECIEPRSVGLTNLNAGLLSICKNIEYAP